MLIGPTPVIVVASQNPVKVEATRRGFARMFPQVAFQVQSVAAASGVRQQPLSDAETLQGARNRTQHAAQLVPQADYWVGIEGGVEERQGSMEAFALYARPQVKHTTGAVGVLTEGVIDRVQLYEHAVVLALVPFKHAQK